jgi:hypothetical protein
MVGPHCTNVASDVAAAGSGGAEEADRRREIGGRRSADCPAGEHGADFELSRDADQRS